jgi:hypothetical protein
MQDQKTLTVNKVPLLGDIPLLKYLFSRTQIDRTKTELLIFMTPHVAQTPDLLDPMTREELKGTQITPDAVSPGTFNDYLQGLRRGAVPEKERIPPRPAVFEPEPATQRSFNEGLRPLPTTNPAQQTVESAGGAGRGDPGQR